MGQRSLDTVILLVLYFSQGGRYPSHNIRLWRVLFTKPRAHRSTDSYCTSATWSVLEYLVRAVALPTRFWVNVRLKVSGQMTPMSLQRWSVSWDICQIVGVMDDNKEVISFLEIGCGRSRDEERIQQPASLIWERWRLWKVIGDNDWAIGAYYYKEWSGPRVYSLYHRLYGFLRWTTKHSPQPLASGPTHALPPYRPNSSTLPLGLDLWQIRHVKDTYSVGMAKLQV